MAARGHWSIADPYFRFWFRFVFPNRSRLARGRITEVSAEIFESLPRFVAPVFEGCCREWVGRHSELGARALQIGSWWSRRSDLEVDVVGVDKKRYLLLGACAWSRRRVTTDALDELLSVRAALGPKAARAGLAIFSKSGFSSRLEDRAERDGVTLVEGADLFRPATGGW